MKDENALCDQHPDPTDPGALDSILVRAQALSRKLLANTPGVSVDDFLGERRREAEHE